MIAVEAKLSQKNEKVGKILSFRAINSIRAPTISDTIILLASKSYAVSIIGRTKHGAKSEIKRRRKSKS